MINELKALLTDQKFIRAVIIDDAFDDRPRAGDVHISHWDRFFDDLSEDDETSLSEGYGAEAYSEADAASLARDQRFVDIVWNERAQIRPAAALFNEFERTQEAKRAQLKPLQTLLEQRLDLSCAAYGREDGVDFTDTNFVFLDLFLGFLEDEAAIRRAIDRVKVIVASRQQNPPSVVLLSASPRLEELGPRLRDEAELLGCQFRMIKKSELADADLMVERLYDLAVSYPDALRLNSFLLAWDRALTDARVAFLKSIRTLDLADYANMQALILEAEGEPVGDYILDLYDLHLHNVLEGNQGLVRAAKVLNEISWTEYPPAQFMPSSEAVSIMDGALFHNKVRTDVESEIENDPTRVRLGDVFLGPELTTSNVSSGDPARYAYVVLSQACDLQHGDAERLILLRGSARPYGWRQHNFRAQGPRTPVMVVGDQQYAIEWDVLAPETWLLEEIQGKLELGFKLVRRFRTPFALQLQQAFIGRLGRVGTLAALPGQYSAGIRVFLRDRANKARLLAQAPSDAGKAVCLVGRTEKNSLKEWLLLSEEFRSELRKSLREIPEGDLPNGHSLATLRDDPAFFRRFKGGLVMNREAAKGSKPFKDTKYDVVQIVTQKIWDDGCDVDRSYHPILVEVNLD
jgi:hypothetical protein